MNIYVGNLDFSIKEDDLKNLFAEYGEVSSVKIITDKFSGRSKGFAFITMDDDSEGQSAVNELNGSEFKGRNMVVNEARPKKDDYNRR
jgi:RNA recognition motif-containing protein